MAYYSAYRQPRHRRHRHRRRNSHYGVLIALILLVVVLVLVAARIVRGVTGAIFSGGQTQIVYQLDNSKAVVEKEVIDLEGAAPYADEQQNVMIPVQSLCDQLGFTLEWDQTAQTVTVSDKKHNVSGKIGSTALQINGQSGTSASALKAVNGVPYVPAKDFGQALELQVSQTDSAQGDYIVITKSKKELSESKLADAVAAASSLLGPSRAQVEQTSVLMRVGSDKLLLDDKTSQMIEDGQKRGAAATEGDGLRYVPLKAAIEALGGTAEYNGSSEWTVEYDGVQSIIKNSGKTKVDGKSLKGGDIKVYTDEESGHFYVSAPLFASVIGRTYTDLADGDGTFAFTKVSLDGFDAQKSYLESMKNSLTDAISADIPEADVYIALTFDDGPTGKMDSYPDGLTNYLLDGLKERGAKATFFECGYRIKEYSACMPRQLEEGSEIANHTMNHPDSRLTGLSREEVDVQINSNSELIKEKTGSLPTLLRPVGGGVNDTVKAVAKEAGLPIINWSVDTQDWKYRDAEHVKQVIVDNAGDGDIVLMHDLYATSVEGALAAIDELQSRTDKTYAFVTVSQLAAIKGITLEPGVVYNSLTEKVAQEIADGTYSPTEFT